MFAVLSGNIVRSPNIGIFYGYVELLILNFLVSREVF